MTVRPQSHRERIVVDLAIEPEHLKRLYRGTATTVVARARDGRWIRFPALALRRHVGGRGVQGAYVLELDGTRLTSMERLDA